MNNGGDFANLQMPEIKAKGRGDIVFVVDITSSMTPCIEGVKESFKGFFSNLKKLGVSMDGEDVPWRIKFVTFKDLDCATDTEPKLDTDRPFVSSEEDVNREIDSIEILKFQGCDEPESVWEAIYSAIRKSDWRPAEGKDRVHRVIVVFTDAPPKTEFNTSVLLSEDMDMFDPKNVEDIITFLYNLLAEEKVKIMLYAPENEYYRKLCDNAYKGYYYSVGSEKDVYEGLKNVDYKSLFELLAKTISE